MDSISSRRVSDGELSNRVAILEATNSQLSSSLAAAISSRKQALQAAQQAKQDAGGLYKELQKYRSMHSGIENSMPPEDWAVQKKKLEEESLHSQLASHKVSNRIVIID